MKLLKEVIYDCYKQVEKINDETGDVEFVDEPVPFPEFKAEDFETDFLIYTKSLEDGKKVHIRIVSFDKEKDDKREIAKAVWDLPSIL